MTPKTIVFFEFTLIIALLIFIFLSLPLSGFGLRCFGSYYIAIFYVVYNLANFLVPPHDTLNKDQSIH